MNYESKNEEEEDVESLGHEWDPKTSDMFLQALLNTVDGTSLQSKLHRVLDG